MTPGSPRSDWSTLTRSAADMGLGALAAACCVEPIALWPLTLGLVSSFALALALPLALLRSRRVSEQQASWLVAGAIVLGVSLVARPWSLQTGWPIVLGSFGLFASGPLWVGAARKHRAFAFGLCAAAVLTLWISVRVYVGLYPSLHVAAVVLGLALATLGVSRILLLNVRPKLASGIVLAMLALCALLWTPWASRNEVRQLAIARPCIAPHLLAIAWQLSDVDSDDASALFGGADCDAFDPERGPLSRDVPGDGIDQDCTGGDRRPPPRKTQTSEPATREPMTRARAVVIVTADSLRPDALGAYGSQPLPVSVHFDRFAARAARFERVYAAAPETRSSLPVLLYGDDGPADGAAALAQRVKERGLAAHAVLSTHARFSEVARVAGFDVTEVDAADSALLSAAALSPLDQVTAHGGLLWVHFHDPHAPYVQVPGISWGTDARARYLGLVTRMDRAFGELLARIPPDVAVIFSADHGEAFGEHGMYYHRSSLYDEQIRIPLAIAAPGMSPRIVTETVGLIDVYATALDLLAVPATPGVSSRSLVPALLGETLADVPYRATTVRMSDGASAPRVWIGVFYGRYKLLRRTDWNVDEVYDVIADPGELEPNVGAAAAMREQLIDLL